MWKGGPFSIVALLILHTYLGENLFGEDIKTTLLSLQNSIEREQFILMDKITPMSHKAQIYQNGSVLETEVVPEISCGGVFVR